MDPILHIESLSPWLNKSVQGVQNTPDFDSTEEAYFWDWCVEAYKKNLILCAYRPPNLELFSSVKLNKIKQLKTKTKLVEEHLLNNLSYQADLLIIWHEKAIDTSLCSVIEDPHYSNGIFRVHKYNETYYSIIDIKPSFGGKHNNSFVEFPIKKKIMWNVFGFYINKIVPYATSSKSHLFSKTWTPNNYLFTPTGKVRSLNYQPKTISQWLLSENFHLFT